MKKLLAVVMAMAMILSLAACMGGEASTPAPTEEPAETAPAETAPAEGEPAEGAEADPSAPSEARGRP